MLLAVSDITREVDHAFLLIGGVGLLLLIAITVAMIWFVIKYRRSQRKTTEQIEGHTTLEIVWIVIPTIIVIWMFFVGYKGFLMMRNPPDDAMVVNVVGRQWSWSFNYPESGLTTPKLYVPVNTPVKLLMTAPRGDVIHSFYIPDFRVKEDVLPEKETMMWFKAERTGTYNVFCAEFCGKGHAEMLTELIVLEKNDYDEWEEGQLAQRRKPLELPGALDPKHAMFQKLGMDRLYNAYCASCHASSGNGAGYLGARDFTKNEGWKRGQRLSDIYRTLAEGIKGTAMRPYPQLSDWERFALAHKVQSYYTGDVPKDSDEDIAKLAEEYGLGQKVETPKALPIEDAMEALIKEGGASKQDETKKESGDG